MDISMTVGYVISQGYCILQDTVEEDQTGIGSPMHTSLDRDRIGWCRISTTLLDRIGHEPSTRNDNHDSRQTDTQAQRDSHIKIIKMKINSKDSNDPYRTYHFSSLDTPSLSNADKAFSYSFPFNMANMALSLISSSTVSFFTVSRTFIASCATISASCCTRVGRYMCLQMCLQIYLQICYMFGRGQIQYQ